MREASKKQMSHVKACSFAILLHIEVNASFLSHLCTTTTRSIRDRSSRVINKKLINMQTICLTFYQASQPASEQVRKHLETPDCLSAMLLPITFLSAP